MKQNQPVRINRWLLPFSWLYAIVVFLRNKFFDWRILKRESYDIPVICIGNITAGGTGKTPHVEYLAGMLKDEHRVAVLSRGYMRKTSGFVLAAEDSTAKEIGDEPFQIKCKYPDVLVAVDANRRRGINNLLELDTPPDIIILDDAFQHRYVKPSFTILLSNYFRPVYEDKLLPAGRLREGKKHMNEANMVFVTKCPTDLKPIDFRIISHDIRIFPYQDLLFTSFSYLNLKSVFDPKQGERDMDFLNGKSVLLVTGIASPQMIIEKLAEYTDKVEMITYADHYNFKKKDIKNILKKFDSIDSPDKIILVTEKDAARLIGREDIDEDYQSYFYSLPISVSFLRNEDEKLLKDKILKHVKEYTRNSNIPKK